MTTGRDAANGGTSSGRWPVEVRLAAGEWPVATGYAIRDGIKGPTIAATGAVVGGAVRRPEPSAALVEELCLLAEADDARLLAWVGKHGLLGVDGDHMARDESLDDVTYSLRRLRDAAALLDELHSDRPSRETLHELARTLTGDHVPGSGIRHDAYRARALAAGIGEEEVRSLPPRLAPDLDAYEALAHVFDTAIRELVRVRVGPVRATRDRLRAMPMLVAEGWLGAAYLHLFDRFTRRAIGRLRDRHRLTSLSGERPCAGCGALFVPSRPDRLYHSAQCGWAARKRRNRARR